MNWNIQKAQAGDAAAIADFQMDMALKSEGLVLDREIVERGVKAALEDSSKGIYFVARDESGVVAGSLFLTKEWSENIKAYFVGRMSSKPACYKQ